MNQRTMISIATRVELGLHLSSEMIFLSSEKIFCSVSIVIFFFLRGKEKERAIRITVKFRKGKYKIDIVKKVVEKVINILNS